MGRRPRLHPLSHPSQSPDSRSDMHARLQTRAFLPGNAIKESAADCSCRNIPSPSQKKPSWNQSLIRSSSQSGSLLPKFFLSSHPVCQLGLRSLLCCQENKRTSTPVPSFAIAETTLVYPFFHRPLSPRLVQSRRAAAADPCAFFTSPGVASRRLAPVDVWDSFALDCGCVRVMQGLVVAPKKSGYIAPKASPTHTLIHSWRGGRQSMPEVSFCSQKPCRPLVNLWPLTLDEGY